MITEYCVNLDRIWPPSHLEMKRNLMGARGDEAKARRAELMRMEQRNRIRDHLGLVQNAITRCSVRGGYEQVGNFHGFQDWCTDNLQVVDGYLQKNAKPRTKKIFAFLVAANFLDCDSGTSVVRMMGVSGSINNPTKENMKQMIAAWGEPSRRVEFGQRGGRVMMDDGRRAVLSRVVFYDLLAVPGRDRDPRFGSHITIPQEPATQPVWAPNGNGKTYAFNHLSKLSHTSDYSDADVGTGDFGLGNFLKECYAEVREPSHWMTIGELHTASPTKGAMASSWKTDDSQRMVPFTHMLARFKILDLDSRVVDVWDLWVQPIWEGGGSYCRTRLRTLSGLMDFVDVSTFYEEDAETSLRIQDWSDIHRGRGDPTEREGGEDDLFTNGWRMFDFLRDDGDFEIPSLFGEVLLEDQARHSIDNSPAAQMREFCKLQK